MLGNDSNSFVKIVPFHQNLKQDEKSKHVWFQLVQVKIKHFLGK